MTISMISLDRVIYTPKSQANELVFPSDSNVRTIYAREIRRV